MQPFVVDILIVVVAAALAALVVVFLRPLLVRLFSSRAHRLAFAIVLLVLQLVIGFFVASIDYGDARKTGRFSKSDAVLMRWLIPLSALALAIETFVLLQASDSEKEREALTRKLASERAAFVVEIDAAHEERDRAREERDFATLTSWVFLTVVSRKRERLNLVRTKEQLIDSLQPRLQMTALIQACWELFHSLAPDPPPENFRLRVAYYRRTPEALEVAFAWNGTSKDCVPPWDADVLARFRFDHPDGCLALAAARDGTIYRVADTAKAHAKRSHPFVFFDDTERKTLKSIAALPVRFEGEPPPYGVLVVDTNLEAFFNPEDRRQELVLEEIVGNLAHRLRLEERMESLLGGN